MNTEQIIKPCPFCGGEASLKKFKTKHFVDEDMIDAYCVICNASDCGCLTQCCRTQKEAENMWNRRVNDEHRTDN